MIVALAIIIVGSSVASLLIARWMRRRSVHEMSDNTLWGELAWELRDLDDAETRMLLRFVRRMKKARDPAITEAAQDLPLPASGIRKRRDGDDPEVESARELAG